jgi:type IV pilus assembly protein PilN
MIRINLLPFRSTRKKENIRRQLSVFVLSLILAVVAIFGANLLLGNQIDDLNSRITTTQSELVKYDKINKEIEEIKKKLDNLNKKLAVIRELEANRYEPVRLMDTLSQVIVEKRMWYTALDMKSELVTIRGIAIDDKTVADFMLRLESSGLFSTVNLKTLKQTDVQKTAVKSFEISCRKQAVHTAETKTTEGAGVKK